MHFQDDMNGFLTALKGGAHDTNPALPAPTHTAVGTAIATGPTPLRNPRSLNGFGPPFPSFSGAISSDRLSAGGGGGPVSRTFSVLRSTGEPSLGSFNNSLHPVPPSLSADPPLHSASIPQRSPPSPIPHLNPSAFANNSTYHPFGLSHLNQSPSSVARNTLNYSPQPPPPASVTVTATAPHSHPTSAPLRAGIPPHIVQHPPPASHHPIATPIAHSQQQQPSRQPTPVEQPADPSPAQSRPQETSQTQMQQPYSQYAAPQPQPMYKGPMVDPNSVVRNSTPLPHSSRPLRPPEPPTTVTNAPRRETEARTEPKRGRSSHTPSKRARSNARHSSPNTPRSTTGGGGSGAHGWATQNAGSNKSRSGTTVPSNTDGTANGHATSGTEEQSRPERKREREKRRRETMNTRFNELAQCLVISAGGKSDKESILAEAVDHCKKQAAAIRELEKKNQELASEARDLRAEKSELRQDKNYLREERDRLKSELDVLKAELESKKRQKIEYDVKYDVKRDEVKRQSSKRNGETASGRKSEPVRV